MVWYGMVWYGRLWYGMVWYAMVCYGMLCYAMLCYATLCYAMLCVPTSLAATMLASSGTRARKGTSNAWHHGEVRSASRLARDEAHCGSTPSASCEPTFYERAAAIASAPPPVRGKRSTDTRAISGHASRSACTA